jgi:rod shape-determining protein MreD
LIITLALGLLQVTFLDQFKVFGIEPDFFLTTVVIAGLFFEIRLAVVFGACIGFFKDIFSLGTFGWDILLFSLWAFLTVKISRKVAIEDNITRTLLLFVIALMQNIAVGLSSGLSGSSIPFGIFLRVVFLSALYTALPLPLILKITKTRI